MTIIGLGHRARHGKDTLAEKFNEQVPNCLITHWADPLKEEVINKKRKLPLIRYVEDTFALASAFHILENERYITFPAMQFPMLVKIFKDRNISEYVGMDEKDSLMLQFWGTDYRRNNFGEDYWVKRTMNFIKEESEKRQIDYVLIPDTRFKNELNAVWETGGIYVRTVRYNKDGSEYRDPERDPNHPSETEIKDVTPDYNLVAMSGEMKKFDKAVQDIIEVIKKRGPLNPLFFLS